MTRKERLLLCLAGASMLAHVFAPWPLGAVGFVGLACATVLLWWDALH